MKESLRLHEFTIVKKKFHFFFQISYEQQKILLSKNFQQYNDRVCGEINVFYFHFFPRLPLTYFYFILFF